MLKITFKGEKISFDFDGTLSTTEGKALAASKIKQGFEVYIVTARRIEQKDDVLKVADELGIPKSRIYFTNGADKWPVIKRLGIKRHYDNNKEQVDKINSNTQAEGVLWP